MGEFRGVGIIMRVAVCLALLVWGISHREVEGGRASLSVSMPIKEDLDMERELRRLNKPAIKSFETEHGDIFDCVDINKQPALDHPLLKNHKVQKKPSVFPEGLRPQASAEATTLTSKIGLPDGGCPKGTVPIKRMTKRDLIWMKSQKRNTSKFNPMDGNTPGYHQAFTRRMPGKYYGAQGGISLESEPAAERQYNRAMMTVSNGSPDRLNVIQVGWMVEELAYGDGSTRLFIWWTADSFNSTGCRDLLCPGFVQVDEALAPGMAFSNVSIVNGPQYDYTFAILQTNPYDGKWWLIGCGAEVNVIGYWPKVLFPDMRESFSRVEWGGYLMYDPEATTAPPMGSGQLPYEGYGKAAYFKDIKVINSTAKPTFEALTQLDVMTYSDEVWCYNLGGKARDFPGTSPGSYSFYYGGPGGHGCHP